MHLQVPALLLLSAATVLTVIIITPTSFANRANLGFNSHYPGNHHHRRESVVSIELEGGICGLGENYTYFVRPGDSQYVAFIFRGYGFCYDDETCSNSPDTDIDIEFNKLILREYPQFSNSDPFDSDSLTWTLVLFPQCTEDFHVGYNSVYLGNNSGLFHFQGGNNINLVINEIVNGSYSSDSFGRRSIADYVNFDEIKHFTMIGISSGCYGAAAWSNQLFDLVSENALKTLIIDSFWLNSSLENEVTPILVGLYNALESPAFTEEIKEIMATGGDVSIPGLITVAQDTYCDLFVSLLFYEYDTVMAYYHYFFSNDVSFFDFTFWTELFLKDLLDRWVFDTKRTSHYVAQGSGHQMFLDTNWTDISTQCDEAMYLNEYISNVVGGDRALVRKYYGNSVARVRQFPKYSWNNLNIECLDCM